VELTLEQIGSRLCDLLGPPRGSGIL
jgi:hypothetical protein